MYWQVKKFWPHEEAFSKPNFGYQPDWLITQAIKHGSQFNYEQLHFQELGISVLNAQFRNSHLGTDSQPAQPRDYQHFAELACPDSNKLPAIVCDTFWSLVPKLPSWAVAVAPVDELKRNQQNKSPAKTRAWMGDGLLLLVPRPREEKVFCGLVLIDDDLISDSPTCISVWDFDTQEAFEVELPATDGMESDQLRSMTLNFRRLDDE